MESEFHSADFEAYQTILSTLTTALHILVNVSTIVHMTPAYILLSNICILFPTQTLENLQITKTKKLGEFLLIEEHYFANEFKKCRYVCIDCVHY